MGSDSGSNKSGSKKDSGPNFFDNLSEDLGNVLSGKGTGRHSAYDVRNAKARAIRTGRKQKDFLPGGAYGPGGGSYSPSTLHKAGVRQQKALDAERVANEKIKAQRSKTSAIVAARKMDAQRALKSQADIPGPMTRSKDDQMRDGQVNEAVGPFGKNRPDDVKSLQRALATTKDFDIAVTGEADGLPGQRLIGAVQNFQNRNGLKVDGIVMPNGPTATALSQTVGGAPVASTRPAKPFGEPQAPGELVPQQGNLPKGNVAISPSAEAANLKRQMDDKKKAEDAARKQAEQRTRQNAMDYEAQAYTVGAPAAAQPRVNSSPASKDVSRRNAGVGASIASLLDGNLVDVRGLDPLGGFVSRKPQSTPVTKVAEATENQSWFGSLFEPSEEQREAIRAWESYQRQWRPDYKWHGNNMTADYNNPGGKDVSTRAARDAANVAAKINTGRALSLGSNTVDAVDAARALSLGRNAAKGPVGATMGVAGALLEENGQKEKKDFLARDYRKYMKNKK